MLTGYAVVVTIQSAKSVLKPGDLTFLSVIVDPTDDVVCILNFGDNDCAVVLDKRSINVKHSETEYGVAMEHMYASSGVYTCTVVCHGVGPSAYESITLTVPHPLTGLQLIPDHRDKVVLLTAFNGRVLGSVNFTFESGTSLSGLCTTDEGKDGLVHIDEEDKTGFVSFTSADFISYGTHLINITLFNIYNNSNSFYEDVRYDFSVTLQATVLYEEQITAVSIEALHQALVGSVVTMVAKIGSGSNVNITWSCVSSLPCWDVSTGHRHEHNFTHAGHYRIGLLAENVLGNVTAEHSLEVREAVDGFSVSWQKGSIYLHTPDKNLSLIGDLFVQIRDEFSSVILPQTTVHLKGREILIFENVPVHIYRLEVRVFSNLSFQLLEIERNITVVTESVVPFSVLSEPVIPLPDGQASFTVQSEQPSSNATSTMCTIDFEDSSPTIELPYQEMVASDVKHTFTKGGFFNVTFVCENEVQFWLTEVKAFTAADFRFAYSDVLPWNSTEESSTAIIHIILDGFSKPPTGVKMVWNFGDDSSVHRLNLQSWSIIHTFLDRGFYNMSVEVIVDGADNFTIVLPIRIGLLIFTAFPRTGFLNRDQIAFDISGAHGNSVLYEVDFGDGMRKVFNKTHVDRSEVITISKTFHIKGSFRPHLHVWSQLFEEDIFLPFEITIFSPIANLSLYIEAKVNYPPGKANVTFYLNEEISLNQPTLMWCVVNFDDGSPLERFAFEPQLERPFEFSHTFSAVGKMRVHANCSFDNETIIFSQNQTNVVSNCYGSSSPFSNLKRVIKSTVSERVTIAARPDILCMDLTPEFTWRVELRGEQVGLPQPNSSLLVLAPRYMVPGSYRIVFYTNFVEIPTIFISDSLTVVYEQTPLHARIKGGNYKTIGLFQPVILDALTHSYDPDVEPYENSNLKFSWVCSTFGSSEEAYDSENEAMGQPSPCMDLDSMASGLLVLVANCLQVSKWHKFKVTVNKDNRTATNYQIIHVLGNPLQVDLR